MEKGQKFTFLLQNTSEVGGSPNAKHSVMFIVYCADRDYPGPEFLPEGGSALLSSLQAGQRFLG